MTRIRVGVEVRTPGSIGMYTWLIDEFQADSIAEAARILADRARTDGWETRGSCVCDAYGFVPSALRETGVDSWQSVRWYVRPGV